MEHMRNGVEKSRLFLAIMSNYREGFLDYVLSASLWALRAEMAMRGSGIHFGIRLLVSIILILGHVVSLLYSFLFYPKLLSGVVTLMLAHRASLHWALKRAFHRQRPSSPTPITKLSTFKKLGVPVLGNGSSTLLIHTDAPETGGLSLVLNFVGTQASGF